MRVLLFEFVTGGGFLDRPLSEIPATLVAEGAAMRNALLKDIAQLSGAEVQLLCDERFAKPAQSSIVQVQANSVEQRDGELQARSAACDWTLLIAPEFDRHLERLAKQVLAAGGRLLGPPPHVVSLTTDKHRLASHLISAGVSTPRGRALTRHEPLPVDWKYPAVLKPIDGAGSLGVQLIADPLERDLRTDFSVEQWRLEELCPGKPVSVAFLCGPGGEFPLPSCSQDISNDGRFEYSGGDLPLPHDENNRAQRLATAAIATIGDLAGYVGVDLVLGNHRDGSQDVVIEINPRLTTSYVGLRAASQNNLFQAMVDAAEGRVPELSFDTRPIRFAATGAVWR